MRKKIQWLIAKLTDGTPQKMLTSFTGSISMAAATGKP